MKELLKSPRFLGAISIGQANYSTLTSLIHIVPEQKVGLGMLDYFRTAAIPPSTPIT